jgi:hypothetical protein
MPPLPKDPSTRRRRNRTPGARVLTFPKKKTATPELPAELAWHPRTLAWWQAAWRSPMAAEWLDSDVERLFMLALAVEDLWRNGNLDRLSEIRLSGALFGLSPIDRRRLNWEIDRGEEAEERTRDRRSRPSSTQSASSSSAKRDDPRRVLAQ